MTRMSKWGVEEKETLAVIEKMELSGDILNMAAGDGRFNNKLLEVANSVMAVDKDATELEVLKNNCPVELKRKLDTKKLDITDLLPFDDDKFDGVFCTGTLHLFEPAIVIEILQEIKRVLKKKGKIILDFATNLKRFDKNGNKVVFASEGSYSTDEAIELFNRALEDFSLNIEVATFEEEDLDESAGYQYIKGEFLIVSGRKK